METEMKLQSLERSRERFFDSQISNVKRVKREKERLPKFEERLELITADLKEVEATENKSFSIAVHYKGNDRVFTEDDKKTEVAEFLAKQINNNTLAYNFAKATGANDKKITHIATYRNFQILHNPVLGDGEKERLILKGDDWEDENPILYTEEGVHPLDFEEVSDKILKSISNILKFLKGEKK